MGVERCVRFAFETAAGTDRRHLTLVHKKNVLTFAGDLWQRVFDEVAAEYPQVGTGYDHIDAACVHFVERPERYDVIVTDNLFGDILTDLGGAIAGGVGYAASANLDPARTGPSMFEPVHGTAPDIAGKGRPTRSPRSSRPGSCWTSSARPRPRPRSPRVRVPRALHRIDHRDRRRRRRCRQERLSRRPSDAHHTDREDLDERGARPLGRCQIDVLTHTLHYGMGVFEGIRAYETPNGPGVFRLTEHIDRLFNSAKILGMEIPYTVDELVDATKQVVRESGLPSAYIRPIAYYGYGEMGLNTLPCTVDVSIACWPWGAYLGDDAVTKGVRMKISTWLRHDHNSMPPAAKTTGNYVNSSLAKVEALKAGYDEAIMLNGQGLISECTGENIFISRGGALLTPPGSAGALEGLTQDTVMNIAEDLGIECHVTDLTRSDLYVCDEMFVCGTAAEVSAVNSVDDREIPCPGPMTTAIAAEYAKVVRGQVDRYKDWVELVS